jgi:predicted Rossmann fold flavoprotein
MVDLQGYLQNLGIYLTEDKQGKMYPLSKQASSVLDIIRAYLQNKGVQEITGAEVKDIKHINGVFHIKTQTNTYLSKTVILATGGASAKQFGTDGSAYKLAEKFGHILTPIYPSLVQLKTETNLIRSLKGLKETAKITALQGGKQLKSAVGDLLFTEFGVSGSSIFSVSAAITDKQGVSLKIEFLPELQLNEIEDILKKRECAGYIDKENILTGIINKRIGQAVIKTAKSLSPKDVAYALKNFTLKVTGNLGFNYAQVTKGGIKTDTINPNTFESTLQKGLYIVGETLNIDGDCGGYNLSFAFVSAIIASRAIKQNVK